MLVNVSKTAAQAEASLTRSESQCGYQAMAGYAVRLGPKQVQGGTDRGDARDGKPNDLDGACAIDVGIFLMQGRAGVGVGR